MSSKVRSGRERFRATRAFIKAIDAGDGCDNARCNVVSSGHNLQRELITNVLSQREYNLRHCPPLLVWARWWSEWAQAATYEV